MRDARQVEQHSPLDDVVVVDGGLSTNPSEWSLNLIANKSGLDGIHTAKQVMIEFTLGVAGFMSMIRRIWPGDRVGEGGRQMGEVTFMCNYIN